MSQSRKTDNASPLAKLELRRYFLRKYHADDSPRVMDCCQGSGLLWDRLRREFDIASYWGLDLKAKRGRLKLASERVLALPGWPQNVIDVDTYGSPWKHWEALLGNVTQPTTVFLTVGLVKIGGGGMMSNVARRALGIDGLDLPISLAARLHGLAVGYLLTMGADRGIRLVEVVEAESSLRGSARYIGVRLEPGKPSRPKRRSSPPRKS